MTYRNTPPSVDEIPDDHLARVDEICDHFQTEWKSGQTPRIEDFLPDETDPAFNVILAELIQTEAELSSPSEQKIDVSELVARFPGRAALVRQVFDPASAQGGVSTNESVEVFYGGDPANRPEASGDLSPRKAKSNQPSIEGYEIIEEVGRGGMGVVYKARDQHLKRIVALKMISRERARDEHLQRFRREAEAVARLQHPNIIQIYEIGEQDDHPYLSLEYIDGQDLAKFISGEPQSPQFAAEVIEALARAIDYAHSQGVVHRDLKPGNVLLASTPQPNAGSTTYGASRTDADCVGADEKTSPQDTDASLSARGSTTNDGSAAPGSTLHNVGGLRRQQDSEVTTQSRDSLRATPKITDFGLAKQLHADADLTSTGQILGTPAYMSPEQADGRSDVGPLSDVYSLGAVLYVMLTGRPPFQGPETVKTLIRVRTEEPLAPSQLQPGLPVDLDTICLKCLRKEPAQRYSSAAELADELRRYLNHEPILARPIGRLDKLNRWCRRNPAVAALSAACVMTFVVGFMLVFWQWRQTVSANSELAKKNTELTQAHATIRQQFQKEQAISAKLKTSNDSLKKAQDAISEQLKTVVKAQPLGLSLFFDTTAETFRFEGLHRGLVAHPDGQQVTFRLDGDNGSTDTVVTFETAETDASLNAIDANYSAVELNKVLFGGTSNGHLRLTLGMTQGSTPAVTLLTTGNNVSYASASDELREMIRRIPDATVMTVDGEINREWQQVMIRVDPLTLHVDRDKETIWFTGRGSGNLGSHRLNVTFIAAPRARGLWDKAYEHSIPNPARLLSAAAPDTPTAVFSKLDLGIQGGGFALTLGINRKGGAQGVTFKGLGRDQAASYANADGLVKDMLDQLPDGFTIGTRVGRWNGLLLRLH